MPNILSVGIHPPPYKISQDKALSFAREIFKAHFADIERLLRVFHNGHISSRYFSVPLDWFREKHTFREKNNLYIRLATDFGRQAIRQCLYESEFLMQPLPLEKIEAIFFISSSGLSTPSIEARIMNHLPFKIHTKRIPIWGLGCAGGAAGLARAYEYCLAYPQANVLVLSIELCSLTFQPNDGSKSNLVGTSIFADGVACTLVCGDKSDANALANLPTRPSIIDVQTSLMPHSEDVMGWDVQDDGLYVIFSKSIPRIVHRWVSTEVNRFLNSHGLRTDHLQHLIAHPGGKKVLDAYEESLQFPKEMTAHSRSILREYGNMSSATVYYVLHRLMQKKIEKGDIGLVTALGPGFSSELLLLKWI